MELSTQVYFYYIKGNVCLYNFFICRGYGAEIRHRGGVPPREYTPPREYHWLGLGERPPIPVILENGAFLGKLYKTKSCRPLFCAGSFRQIRYMTSPRGWASPNSKN